MNKFMYIFLIILIITTFYAYKNYKEQFTVGNYSINKYFDKIYVIVLEDRRKYIKDVMNKYNIDAEYIDAILKKNVNKKQLITNNILDVNNQCERIRKPILDGQIACHMSHCKVLSKFLSSNSENCLIFEDDVLEPKYDLKYMEYIIENIYKTLPSDYDIIFFGKCWEMCKMTHNVNKFLDKCYKPYCRHAYSVSRKGASKILEMTIPMKMSGDQMISNLIKQNKINAYSSIPTLFYQNRKEIGSKIGNNFQNYDCI